MYNWKVFVVFVLLCTSFRVSSGLNIRRPKIPPMSSTIPAPISNSTEISATTPKSTTISSSPPHTTSTTERNERGNKLSSQFIDVDELRKAIAAGRKRKPLSYYRKRSSGNTKVKIEPGTFSQFFKEKKQRLELLANATRELNRLKQFRRKHLPEANTTTGPRGDNLDDVTYEADLRDKLMSIYELDEDDLLMDSKKEKTLTYAKRRPGSGASSAALNAAAKVEDDPFFWYYGGDYLNSMLPLMVQGESKPVKQIQYALDPAHPALMTHLKHNPLAPYGVDWEAGDKPLKKKHYDFETTLLPLDKTMLVIGLVISWVFMLTLVVCYQFLGGKQYAEKVFSKANLAHYNVDYTALAQFLKGYEQWHDHHYHGWPHDGGPPPPPGPPPPGPLIAQEAPPPGPPGPPPPPHAAIVGNNRRPFMVKMAEGQPMEFIPT